MSKRNAVACVWTEGTPFDSVCEYLLNAMLEGQIVWLIDDSVNIAIQHQVSVVLAHFDAEPKTVMVYGLQGHFCFINAKYASEIVSACRTRHPSSIRELIMYYRDSVALDQEYKIAQLNVRCGLMPGSQAFEKAMKDHSRMSQHKEECDRILHDLLRRDQKKGLDLLRELHEAMARELRSEHDHEFILAWLLERKADGRF